MGVRSASGHCALGGAHFSGTTPFGAGAPGAGASFGAGSPFLGNGGGVFGVGGQPNYSGGFVSGFGGTSGTSPANPFGCLNQFGVGGGFANGGAAVGVPPQFAGQHAGTGGQQHANGSAFGGHQHLFGAGGGGSRSSFPPNFNYNLPQQQQFPFRAGGAGVAAAPPAPAMPMNNLASAQKLQNPWPRGGEMEILWTDKPEKKKKQWQEGFLRMQNFNTFELYNAQRRFLEAIPFDEQMKRSWDEDEEIFFGQKHAIQALPTAESDDKCKWYYFYRPRDEAFPGGYKPLSLEFDKVCAELKMQRETDRKTGYANYARIQLTAGGRLLRRNVNRGRPLVGEAMSVSAASRLAWDNEHRRRMNETQTAPATTHPSGMQTPGFGAAQQGPALHRFYSPPSINESRGNPFVAGANGGRPDRYNVNLDEFAYSGAQPHQRPRHGSPPSSCSGAGRESVSCGDADEQNQHRNQTTATHKIITAGVDVMLKNNLWHPGECGTSEVIFDSSACEMNGKYRAAKKPSSDGHSSLLSAGPSASLLSAGGRPKSVLILEDGKEHNMDDFRELLAALSAQNGLPETSSIADLLAKMKEQKQQDHDHPKSSLNRGTSKDRSRTPRRTNNRTSKSANVVVPSSHSNLPIASHPKALFSHGAESDMPIVEDFDADEESQQFDADFEHDEVLHHERQEQLQEMEADAMNYLNHNTGAGTSRCNAIENADEDDEDMLDIDRVLEDGQQKKKSSGAPRAGGGGKANIATGGGNCGFAPANAFMYDDEEARDMRRRTEELNLKKKRNRK
eukprot:g13553.t1